ncbi:putative Zf-FLZ domain, FCS-Like Zinc finger/14 [Dioscorea sansibarensis]
MNLNSKSPLERDLSTTNGWKNRDSEGVGLAMFASLEKIYPTQSTRKVLPSLNVNKIMMKGFEAKYPALDYLSYCYMCGKRLQGKDIYMYRGESIL